MDGVEATLVTNGTLMTPSLARRIASLEVVVCVSLDGATKQSHERLRGPGSFDPTMRGINAALEAGAEVRISCTVYAGNEAEVEQVLELGRALGVSRVSFNPVNPLGRAVRTGVKMCNEVNLIRSLFRLAVENKHYRHLLRGSIVARFLEFVLLPVRALYCGTGGNTVAVSSNGDLYPCPSYIGSRYSAGNIRTRPFSDLWEGDAFSDFRQLDVGKMNPTCARCPVRYFCGGGCRASTHLGAGRPLTAPGVKCASRREIFYETMWWVAEHPELAEIREEAGIVAESAAKRSTR